MKILSYTVAGVMLLGVPVVIGSAVGGAMAAWYQGASIKPVVWAIAAFIIWFTAVWPLLLISLVGAAPDGIDSDLRMHMVSMAVICAVVPVVPHNGWIYASMIAQYWGIMYMAVWVSKSGPDTR